MAWAMVVDAMYGLLLVVSTALGGSMGWAIALVSLAVRLALLPLTLRVAYRGVEVRAALKRLEPELKRLRARHGKDQAKLQEETARLYRGHGVRLMDGRGVVGMIVQLPIFLGLFGAIQRGLGEGGAFLWVRNIAAPDLPLAAICAALTALSSWLAPDVPAAQRAPMVVLPALLTVLFLSRLAAGLSIYTLAQGVVGLGQAFLVHRRARRAFAA
jgi:YidC/Oxa1 family membrane protein insertase